MLQHFFIATVSLVFLAGCGGAESSTPVETPAGTPVANEGASSESAQADQQDSEADQQGSADESATAPEESVSTAAFNGNVDALKQHIAAGSDLNERDPTSGSTPLITAATFDRRESARILIEGGADLNLKNKEGSTALHTATFLCRTEIVEMLLAAGADKEVMNKVGTTALNGVEGPFEQVRGIYDLLGAVLGPAGLKLDYKRIQVTRPKIAEMLR